MLKFNQIPPTAETSEINAKAIRGLAYEVSGDRSRCINGVAEVCASIVVANVADTTEIIAFADKFADTIADSPDSKHPLEDASSFRNRFLQTAEALYEKSGVAHV